MRQRILMFVYMLPVLMIVSAPQCQAGAATGEGGKAACCWQDGADIALMLKNADQLYSQFRPADAAAELVKVLQLDPRSFEAHVKLSRAHIDIGDMIPESAQNWQERRMKEYRVAENYAREAIKIDPNSTWGYFYVAASLGNLAMLSPVAKQIEMAQDIRLSVERSIALDPQNGFAYHVYGVWHRKMAEIGKMSRVLASVFYGQSLPHGTIAKSIEYLKKSVDLNPTVIVSRLELARSYVAAQNWQSARNFLRSIRDLPIQFSDDAKHKQKAQQLLEEIKEH